MRSKIAHISFSFDNKDFSIVYCFFREVKICLQQIFTIIIFHDYPFSFKAHFAGDAENGRSNESLSLIISPYKSTLICLLLSNSLFFPFPPLFC